MISNKMERGLVNKVGIEVKNTAQHSISYSIVDGIPQSFEGPFPLEGTAPKNSTMLAEI